MNSECPKECTSAALVTKPIPFKLDIHAVPIQQDEPDLS